MLWAASTLAYFGFLRASEFTVPSLSDFNPLLHLTVADIAVDSQEAPTCLRLTIKTSKTDPFRKGCHIYIGRGNPPLCALSALLPYLELRGSSPGPLSIRSNGQPLSRAFLSQWLKDTFAAASIDGPISSHGFRIGAATVARSCWYPRPSYSSDGEVDKPCLPALHPHPSRSFDTNYSPSLSLTLVSFCPCHLLATACLVLCLG